VDDDPDRFLFLLNDLTRRGGVMPNPTSIIRFLLRGPGALQSRTARWTVLALAATGAAFLVWSAVIHLELWSDGYRDISVIGPLFLAQGIGSIILAAAIVALLATALLALSTTARATGSPRRAHPHPARFRVRGR
jgi:hypothetical protein